MEVDIGAELPRPTRLVDFADDSQLANLFGHLAGFFRRALAEHVVNDESPKVLKAVVGNQEVSILLAKLGTKKGQCHGIDAAAYAES